MPTAFGFHPHNYTNRNTLKSGYPVCVSATCNTVGDFKPVAFGVEIEGMRYRYTIKEVKAIKDNHGVFSFDCEYVDFGIIKYIRLMFVVSDCRWMVG
jgi:hypothetical protein